MKRDWLGDLLRGGSLSWTSSDHEAARETRRVLVALLAALVLGIAVLTLLWSAQARGEAPEFTCNPENAPYITRECAP